MKLRNLIAGMTLMLGAILPATSSAAEVPTGMYVPNVELDSEGKGTVVVWLNTEVQEYNSFQMEVYLPEGFEVEKNSRGKYVFTFNTEEDVAPSHNMSSADHDGFIRMLGTSLSAEYILPGNHWLFKFNIQAPEGFTGSADASFKNIIFAEGIRDDHFPEVNFAIMSHDYTTGIEDVTVTAAAGEDVIYDLLGRRVEHPAAPGVYIVNGEKKLLK